MQFCTLRVPVLISFFLKEVINPLLTIPGASSTQINGQKEKRALVLPLHLSRKRGEGGRDHFGGWQNKENNITPSVTKSQTVHEFHLRGICSAYRP